MRSSVWKIPLLIMLVGCHASDDGDLEQQESAIANGASGSAYAVVKMFSAKECSAVLVRPNVVLTAAHCVCPHDAPCQDRAVVYFRDALMNDGTVNPEVLMWGDTVVHPSYVPSDPPVGEDIAIIQLDKVVQEENLAVTPIPVARSNEVVTAGHAVTMIGHGPFGANCELSDRNTKTYAFASVTGFGSNAGSLQEIAVDDPTYYLCEGDSGSPLLNLAGRVIGIASRGGVPGISRYVGTRNALSWLTANMCLAPDPAHPDPNYCNDPLCPCGHGEGDCDVQAHCGPGAQCIHNNGAQFGYPSYYDICYACPAFDPSNPDARFCENPYCTCGLGEGDCDPNQNECGPGLVCGYNNGPAFGLPYHWDVCIRPGPTCGNGQPNSFEACDDGNRTAGDGCSPTCTVESGWTCPTWSFCYRNIPTCFPRCSGGL